MFLPRAGPRRLVSPPSRNLRTGSMPGFGFRAPTCGLASIPSSDWSRAPVTRRAPCSPVGFSSKRSAWVHRAPRCFGSQATWRSTRQSAPFRSSGTSSTSHGKPIFGTWPSWNGGGAGSGRTGGPLVRFARDLWRGCYGARVARAGDSADALGLPRIGRRVTSKARWFWPLALTLLFTDCATKRAVEHRLAVWETRPVVGQVVRFTLSYNRNAATGIELGGNSSRLVLSALT